MRWIWIRGKVRLGTLYSDLSNGLYLSLTSICTLIALSIEGSANSSLMTDEPSFKEMKKPGTEKLIEVKNLCEKINADISSLPSRADTELTAPSTVDTSASPRASDDYTLESLLTPDGKGNSARGREVKNCPVRPSGAARIQYRKSSSLPLPARTQKQPPPRYGRSRSSEYVEPAQRMSLVRPSPQGVDWQPHSRKLGPASRRARQPPNNKQNLPKLPFRLPPPPTPPPLVNNTGSLLRKDRCQMPPPPPRSLRCNHPRQNS